MVTDRRSFLKSTVVGAVAVSAMPVNPPSSLLSVCRPSSSQLMQSTAAVIRPRL